MLCMILIIAEGINISSCSPTTQSPATLPVLEMAQFSNVIIHGTINSAQGDLHINNMDSVGMSRFQVHSKGHC
jgi:hypothetical protein